MWQIHRAVVIAGAIAVEVAVAQSVVLISGRMYQPLRPQRRTGHAPMELVS
jgi:hypothetical protein